MDEPTFTLRDLMGYSTMTPITRWDGDGLLLGHRIRSYGADGFEAETERFTVRLTGLPRQQMAALAAQSGLPIGEL